jgi:hypothetical protein
MQVKRAWAMLGRRPVAGQLSSSPTAIVGLTLSKDFAVFVETSNACGGRTGRLGLARGPGSTHPN